MAYLVDTDWPIDLLADTPEAIGLLSRLASEGIAISVVTYMEAYEGTLEETGGGQTLDRLDAALAQMTLLDLNPAIARRCAIIRAELRRQGRRIAKRAIDLIIAATALEHDLTLVTRNVRDYRDIPGLLLYEPT